MFHKKQSSSYLSQIRDLRTNAFLSHLKSYNPNDITCHKPYISNENENAGDKKDLGNCPECGKPLVEKRGHYGPFIACSGYPDCKYIAKKEKEKPEHIGRQCPKCGSELLKRKSRYGTYFISCSAYPKCKYTESIKKADKDNES